MKVAVMGSGSWGTALSILLCENGQDVRLWSYSAEECEALQIDREHKAFLPGVKIPQAIRITNQAEEALQGAEAVVLATPSRYMRSTMESFRGYLQPSMLLINVAKGLESDTLKTLAQVISEICPENPVAVLSGPSHAEEVSRRIPTSVVAASHSRAAAEQTQNLFMNEYFRVYTNPDLIGVELGGALKNVIALACGISDGMGYGDNTKAALMTRGIAEMARLGMAMGADFHTFNGLSGVGDLIVTCTSMHSRNRRAGILIGQGKTMEEAIQEVKMVVEGAYTAQAAMAFIQRYGVEMPITECVYRILYEKLPVQAVKGELMERKRKSEELSADLLVQRYGLQWKN